MYFRSLCISGASSLIKIYSIAFFTTPSTSLLRFAAPVSSEGNAEMSRVEIMSHEPT